MTEDAPAFDAEGLFDEDYLYFFASRLDAGAPAEAELVVRLLELRPGMEVLDLACGHGRMAMQLAARGMRVTGLDSSPVFLGQARADARAAGADVTFVEGDMRSLPWTERFDAVLSWFTAYGYFDDAGNRRVLAEVARALRPGGRFVLELNHRDWVLRNFRPADLAAELGDDLVLDTREIQPLTGRVTTRRTIIRDGKVRRVPFTVRMFTYPELRDWLLQAGFTSVDVYGEEGTPFTLESRRMIVVALR